MIFLLLSVVLPNMISNYVSGVFSFTVFFLSLGFWQFCLAADSQEILYSCMLALFIQNLSSNVYNVIFYSIFYGAPVTVQFSLSVILMLLIYSVFYFLIIKFLFKPVLNIIEKRKQMVAEQFEKADTANAVVAQVSVGSTTNFASVVVAAGELRRLLLL